MALWWQRWGQELADIVPLLPKKVDVSAKRSAFLPRNVERKGFLSEFMKFQPQSLKKSFLLPVALFT